MYKPNPQDLIAVTSSINKALTQALLLESPFTEDPPVNKKTGIFRCEQRKRESYDVVAFTGNLWIISAYPTYLDYSNQIVLFCEQVAQAIPVIRKQAVNDIPAYMRYTLEIQEDFALPVSVRLQGNKQTAPVISDLLVPTTLKLAIQENLY